MVSACTCASAAWVFACCSRNRYSAASERMVSPSMALIRNQPRARRRCWNLEGIELSTKKSAPASTAYPPAPRSLTAFARTVTAEDLVSSMAPAAMVTSTANTSVPASPGTTNTEASSGFDKAALGPDSWRHLKRGLPVATAEETGYLARSCAGEQTYTSGWAVAADTVKSSWRWALDAEAGSAFSVTVAVFVLTSAPWANLALTSMTSLPFRARPLPDVKLPPPTRNDHSYSSLAAAGIGLSNFTSATMRSGRFRATVPSA